MLPSPLESYSWMLWFATESPPFRHSFTTLLGMMMVADGTLHSLLRGLTDHREGTKTWSLFQKLGPPQRSVLAPEPHMGLIEVSAAARMQFIFSLVHFCFSYPLTKYSPINLLHSNLRGSRSVSKITRLKTISLWSLLNFSQNLPQQDIMKESITLPTLPWYPQAI